MPVRNEDRRGWHLDKKVSVSHIIATLLLASGLFAWGSKLETRITLLEQSNVAGQENDNKQDTANSDRFKEISHQLEMLNAKLDRIIEERH